MLKNSKIIAKKIIRYESTLIKLTCILICILLSWEILNSFFLQDRRQTTKEYIIVLVVLFSVSVIYNLIRSFLATRGYVEEDRIFYISRAIDVALVIIAANIIHDASWFYMFVFAPILYASLAKGFKKALIFMGAAFVSQLLIFFVTNFLLSVEFREKIVFLDIKYLPNIIVIYFLFLYLSGVSSVAHTQYVENDKENQRLVMQLGEKYAQLEIAKNKIKSQYEKMKVTNAELEKANQRLTSSLAELFTLQQITQAISSIIDFKELLRTVNDIIIGVMGCSASTIALVDKKVKKVKIEVSSIIDLKERALLNDNINTPAILEVINSGRSVLDNYIIPEQYPFTKGRNIHSIMCVALQLKGRVYGIVLIEHNKEGAFDEENLRLMEIIGKQISFAVENAELYRKMRELAIRDGLTGIYNRLYFQKRLFEEMDKAREENYPVSIILVDVDHFKIFNDTYGHMFGDKVLVTIARTIDKLLRKEDIFARYGGEEFTILLPRVDVEAAYEKAEELRRKVENKLVEDSLIAVSITVSIGVSAYPQIAKNEYTLLKSADKALYEAKDRGRNCVCIAKKIPLSDGEIL